MIEIIFILIIILVVKYGNNFAPDTVPELPMPRQLSLCYVQNSD